MKPTSPIAGVNDFDPVDLQKRLFASHARVNGYATFQKHSYDHFMTVLLPHIVAEFSSPTVVHDSTSTNRRHVVSLGKVTMGIPTHREPDGKVCMVLPEEARLRQLDYCLPVMVDVVHEVFDLAASGRTTPSSSEARPLRSTTAPPVTQWTMHLPKESRVVYREVPFFEIPVMVKSKFCALSGVSHCTPAGATNNQFMGVKQPIAECPKDEGGYFIVRGLDRTLQMQEGLRNNVPFVFAMRQPHKYGFVAEVRSRHELKMRSTSTLRVYVTNKKGGAPPEILVALPFLPTMDVPLVAVFRMLGFHDVQQMQRFIHNSETPTPPPPHGHREPLREHVEAVCRHAVQHMSEDNVFEFVGKRGTRETTVSSRKSYLLHLLSNEFLPHIGLTNTTVEVHCKAVYLGMMVRRLLVAYHNAPPGFDGNELSSLNIPEVDDRDHYANKRLATAGTMMALLLRQHLRKFVRTLRRTLASVVENRRPLNVATLVKSQKLSGDIRYAFRTGNWSVQRSTTGQNVGITQIVNRMSHLALKSQLGRINTPLNREGKATHPRQAHLSTWGVLCPNETPEGSGCGLVKNLTVLAHVRVGTSNQLVTSALVTFLGVHPVTDVDLDMLTTCPLVCVNGAIVGVCSGGVDPDTLVRDARRARRRKLLPYDTSIIRKPYGVLFTSDAGCVMRPVLVLDKLPNVSTAMRDVDSMPTEELWTWLRNVGAIEYLDKEEESQMRVAASLDDVVRDPPQCPACTALPDGGGGVVGCGCYTHVEIGPTSILGHCALTIPFAERNQAPRNIYQASMGKQAVSVPSLAYQDRFDTQTHVPHYTQRPLVHTGSEEAVFNMGINAVVAVLQFSGYNQEDSIIMNKAFVDRGGFRSTYYTVYNSEERRSGTDPECFENPAEDPEGTAATTTAACSSPKAVALKHGDYSQLDALGSVTLHAPVWPGTVLIGKTVMSQHVHGKKEGCIKRDSSTVFHSVDATTAVTASCSTKRSTVRTPSPSSRVDRVLMTVNREGANCQRVRVRTQRIPIVGDKFCLTPDHDVLTSEGWKPIAAVTRNDCVACLTPHGTLMYLNPTGTPSFENDGELYHIASQQLDLLVTPGHRMYVQACHPNAPFQLLPASDIMGKRVRYKKDAVNDNADFDFVLPDGVADFVPKGAWLEFVGRWITDHQFLPSWVWKLSQRQARLLIQSVCCGRESDGTTCSAYSTNSTRLADDVQRLCLHAGWSGNKVFQSNEQHRWCIRIVRTGNHPSSQREEMVSYTGRVYCLEVPTEVFYVRRNGKPCWTGNSSRHGQKGTIGVLLPQEDMPFSVQTGLTPDILINPCALPSRMTIAHLVECVAAKTGVVLGKFMDGTPFQGCDVDRDICSALHKAGYQRHGNERMINGMTGELLEANVFVGPTYYQRLKHMTLDKVHSRTTGPHTMVTRQPSEGRSHNGGLRLGEMERDCLVSYGASRTLQERYLFASDAYSVPMCKACGLLADPAYYKGSEVCSATVRGTRPLCRTCGSNDVATIVVPYAYKLLQHELAAMGIVVRHTLEEKE